MTECCENCQYCNLLNIYDRQLHRIIGGVEIVRSKAKFENTYCCTYFYDTEKGFIEETLKNDKCECWRKKE